MTNEQKKINLLRKIIREEIRRNIKEDNDGKLLFRASNLTVTRKSDGLNFAFNQPGWYHDVQCPATAAVIVSKSKFKTDTEFLKIKLSRRDKQNVDLADFLYWLSGGNRQWSPGGQSDFNVEWTEMEPIVIKQFGNRFKQIINTCNSMGELVEMVDSERDDFIMDFMDLASENGWEDDDLEESKTMEKFRK